MVHCKLVTLEANTQGTCRLERQQRLTQRHADSSLATPRTE